VFDADEFGNTDELIITMRYLFPKILGNSIHVRGVRGIGPPQCRS